MAAKLNPDALDHLGYEWWMFRCACGLARRHAQAVPTPEHNAFVEAAALHGRGLIHFFYAGKWRKLADDWDVSDLGPMFSRISPVPTVFETWSNETSKSIAHLTQARITGLTAMDAFAVEDLIGRLIDEVRKSLGVAIPNDWIGNRDRVAGDGSALPDSGVLGPTGSSGAAST
jgi:hypothetical protein